MRFRSGLMKDGLVQRYDPEKSSDGLKGGEGTFLACSFWMVTCLWLMGRKQEAKEMFDRLLALRNDVGLLSEEYDAQDKRMLGNFPQALSHIALTHAAFTLSGQWTAGAVQREDSVMQELQLGATLTVVQFSSLFELTETNCDPKRAREQMQGMRRVPSSTYRLQLHKGFTFDDAAAIAEYLKALGVTHVYSSPYLQAAPGSMHGYDVVDHRRVNEELGGAAAHERVLQDAGRSAGWGRCWTLCRTT